MASKDTDSAGQGSAEAAEKAYAAAAESVNSSAAKVKGAPAKKAARKAADLAPAADAAPETPVPSAIEVPEPAFDPINDLDPVTEVAASLSQAATDSVDTLLEAATIATEQATAAVEAIAEAVETAPASAGKVVEATKTEKPKAARKESAAKVTAPKLAGPKPVVARVVKKSPVRKVLAKKPAAISASVVPVVARAEKATVRVAPAKLSLFPVFKNLSFFQTSEAPKDTIMAETYDFTSKVQDSVQDMTQKAKAAYEKSTALLGDYADFAKGNVEAVVEASKIFATGVQDISRSAVADSKTAFDSVTAEVKELASVKTPAEFFQLQQALIKKHFDDAVAYSSKSSEATLKLVNEAFAPISTRMSLAVEKVKAVA